MRRPSVSATALVLALLAGCNLIPDFQPPEAPVPASFPNAGATAQGATAAADIPWRSFFLDERVRRLIELALANNRDLRIAALKIESARAQYQIKRADLFPTVALSAADTATLYPYAVNFQPTITRLYGIGLGFSSYELDVFGRLRSLQEQALDTFLASEASRRSVQITLAAEVANAYLTLASDREHRRIAQATLENRQATYDLVSRRFEKGSATELDLRQSESALDTARGDLASYTSQVGQDENALLLLVGTSPPAEIMAGAELSAVTSLADLPAGLPSEVLLRRPDVVSAENQLLAANANIGAARARFFPSFSLTASAGLASYQFNNWLTTASSSWTLGPQATLPIFDMGRNLAILDSAKVDREIAVAQYEKTIQTAFREVADALAQRATLGEQLAAQEAQVEATRQSLVLSEARFRRGVDSFLEVLDSQRSSYTAQQNLVAVRLARYSNQVTLYKTLGGGWQ